MTSSLTKRETSASSTRKPLLGFVLVNRASVNLSHRGAARQETLGVIRAQLQVGPPPAA
jgi:hypothetical protein